MIPGCAFLTDSVGLRIRFLFHGFSCFQSNFLPQIRTRKKQHPRYISDAVQYVPVSLPLQEKKSGGATLLILSTNRARVRIVPCCVCSGFRTSANGHYKQGGPATEPRKRYIVKERPQRCTVRGVATILVPTLPRALHRALSWRTPQRIQV